MGTRKPLTPPPKIGVAGLYTVSKFVHKAKAPKVTVSKIFAPKASVPKLSSVDCDVVAKRRKLLEKRAEIRQQWREVEVLRGQLQWLEHLQEASRR